MADIGALIKEHPQIAIIGAVGGGIILFMLAGKSNGSQYTPASSAAPASDFQNPPANDYASMEMVRNAIADALAAWQVDHPTTPPPGGTPNPPQGEPGGEPGAPHPGGEPGYGEPGHGTPNPPSGPPNKDNLLGRFINGVWHTFGGPDPNPFYTQGGSPIKPPMR